MMENMNFMNMKLAYGILVPFNIFAFLALFWFFKVLNPPRWYMSNEILMVTIAGILSIVAFCTVVVHIISDVRKKRGISYSGLKVIFLTITLVNMCVYSFAWLVWHFYSLFA